jgi:hypothetical protein
MRSEVDSDLRALLAHGELDLPDPGCGRSSDRLVALFELARTHPVSVARLAEGHTDAVSILCEAVRQPRPDSLCGVWASAGSDDVHVRTSADGSRHLRGVKPFASGLDIVDRALVTVIDNQPIPTRWWNRDPGLGQVSSTSRTLAAPINQSGSMA